MEVLLTQSKAMITHYCEGLPIVPTLVEVTRLLAKERREEEGETAASAGR